LGAEDKKENLEVKISEEALKEAAKFIEEEEGPFRRLRGKKEILITVLAVAMSIIHLYASVGVIMTQFLRGIHVMFVLLLTFLVFPPSKRFKDRILWCDFVLAFLGVVAIAHMLIDFEEFIYRVPTPISGINVSESY
jgi:TRAP-type uncharacterized transport system fused permease subunit